MKNILVGAALLIAQHAAGVTVYSTIGIDGDSSTIVQTTPGQNSLDLDISANGGHVIIRRRGLVGDSVIMHGMRDKRD